MSRVERIAPGSQTSTRYQVERLTPTTKGVPLWLPVGDAEATLSDAFELAHTVDDGSAPVRIQHVLTVVVEIWRSEG